VGRKPDGDWPALEVAAEADLASRLTAAVAPDVAFDPSAADVGFVHRRLPDADVYFVANTANVPRTVTARFRAQTRNAERWNAFTGQVERMDVGEAGIALALESYGTRVIVFRPDGGDAPLARKTSVVATEDLRSGWTVSYGGAPSGTVVDLPHSWAEDPARSHYSGSVTYSRRVILPPGLRRPGERVFLDFGEAKAIEPEPLPSGTLRGNSFAALVAPPIREAATVFVNSRRAGSAWAPPYRVDLTDLLRDGANEIRIEVYNTAINRLAEGGHLPDTAALVERYGQRFRLQDLEGLRPLPSGILSVPRIVAER
jgi:glycosyl hydrolase family 106( putative alpha-L-rhamnosidase)